MTPNRWTAAALLLGIAIGFALSGAGVVGIASGQNNVVAPAPVPAAAAAEPQVGRFRISAYGHSGGDGCYIVDSATGEMWRSQEGRKPTPAGKLPAPPKEKN